MAEGSHIYENNTAPSSTERFQHKSYELLRRVRDGALAAGTALMILFSNPASAQLVDKKDPTITSIIQEFEEKEFATADPTRAETSQEVLEHVDGIARILSRLDHVGAQEFMNRNFKTANLDLPLNSKENRHVIDCLIHNMYREAGSSREIAVGGDWAVALVTVARAMDPSMRFYGADKHGDVGDICKVVKADKQFSWTFDRRILSQMPTDRNLTHFKEMRRKLVKLIGNKTPREALEVLQKHLQLDKNPLFYHHKDMWGEYTDGDGVVRVYGTKPVQVQGEPDDQFAIRFNRYRMSERTAKFFAKLRAEAYVTQIGSHDFFGDLPRTLTPAARRNIDERRARDSARGKRHDPTAPVHIAPAQ